MAGRQYCPNIIASSSDDRTIKIWDVRLAKSAKTIGGHIGRVSTLLAMPENVLISGSCPDDLKDLMKRPDWSFGIFVGFEIALGLLR